MGRGNKLSAAMKVGMERHRQGSEVRKRKRLLKKFLKSERGQELAAQVAADQASGGSPTLALSEDNKAVEVTRTLDGVGAPAEEEEGVGEDQVV